MQISENIDESGHIVEIAGLEQDHILHYWADIEQALEMCPRVWEDYYSLPGLRQEALDGRCQIWTVGDGTKWKVFIFTTVRVYQSGERTLQIFLAIGSGIDEYLPILDATLDRFASIMGCQTVTIVGREGWARKLRSIGFRTESITLVRRVKSSLNS